MENVCDCIGLKGEKASLDLIFINVLSDVSNCK